MTKTVQMCRAASARLRARARSVAGAARSDAAAVAAAMAVAMAPALFIGAVSAAAAAEPPPPPQLPQLPPPPRVDMDAMERILPLAPRTDAPVGVIDRTRRGDVLQRWWSEFVAYDAVPYGWTGGNVQSCLEGANSAAHNDAVLRRVNYYRAMAGLPGSVVENPGFSAKGQKAALVYNRNGGLDHYPPSSWTCWTQDAYDAGSHSNIALGVAGTDAVDAYMDDSGAGNTAAGHRRWILYPRQTTFGTGSIPPGNGWSSNALWVLDTASWGARPAQPEWVAWPPPGFVPHLLLPLSSNRWSFSLNGADFGATTVSVTRGATTLGTTKEAISNGYGDNTLVWVVSGVDFEVPPAADTTYRVTLNNVNPGARSFVYDVTVIDPRPPLKALYRSSVGRWFVDRTMDPTWDERVSFGAAGGSDRPLLADFAGSGVAAFAIYRNGAWYFDANRDGVAESSVGFGGAPGDVPLAADFNGDRRADLVIYRAGVWYVSTQRNGVADRVYWFGGASGDIPLAADFDGDGIADLAIYRSGVWYVDTNRDFVADQVYWFGGVPGDIPLAFDWDGDGRADLAVYRAGTWFVSTGRNGVADQVFPFGAAGDIPLGARAR